MICEQGDLGLWNSQVSPEEQRQVDENTKTASKYGTVINEDNNENSQ